jgi:hypothetical protein
MDWGFDAMHMQMRMACGAGVADLAYELAGNDRIASIQILRNGVLPQMKITQQFIANANHNFVAAEILAPGRMIRVVADDLLNYAVSSGVDWFFPDKIIFIVAAVGTRQLVIPVIERFIPSTNTQIVSESLVVWVYF